MTHAVLRRAPALAVAILPALPAHADLSAMDVWKSWQDTSVAAGQTLSVAETVDQSGRLVLNGVTIEIDQPAKTGGATVTIDQISFVEDGNGGVRIETPPEYGLRIVSTPGVAPETAMEFTVSQTDHAVLATGDPSAIGYAITAPRTDIRLDSVTSGGKAVDVTAAAALESMTASYNVTGGADPMFATRTDIGAMAINGAFKDPKTNADMNVAVTVEGMSSTSEGSLSPFSGGQNILPLLKAGKSTRGTSAYTSARYKIDGTSARGPVLIEGSSGAGELTFSLSGDGLVYGGSNTDVAMSILAPNPMVPPVSFNAARTSGAVTMPVVASETPQDFGVKIGFEDLTLSDALWSMFDPTGGLPRDPANLTLDIAGTGVLSLDIMDPASVGTMSTPPGQLDSLRINQIALSIIGAALTGNGAIEFDNSTKPPKPEGKLDLKLVGANALIDTLVGIGLIPQDQAMGARMMLGLFARPGDGEDTLVSTIEVTKDGAVLANGQRIR